MLTMESSLTQSELDMLRLSGHTIRAIRKKRKYTQEKLAELCGLSEATIRNMESGKCDYLLGTLARVLDALEVTLLEFAQFRLKLLEGKRFRLNPRTGLLDNLRVFHAPDVTCRADDGHPEQCVFILNINGR